MKFELRYFTGTGNSLRILDRCRETFLEAGHTAAISEINLRETKIKEADIIGFCLPVYAFGIPRICRKYFRRIKKFENKQRAFVIITGGDAKESGFSVVESEQLLKKKNCEIIYSGVIQMPNNWITSPVPPFPPSKEEANVIIRKGAEQAKRMANDIISGIMHSHVFSYPARYTKVRFIKITCCSGIWGYKISGALLRLTKPVMVAGFVQLYAPPKASGSWKADLFGHQAVSSVCDVSIFVPGKLFTRLWEEVPKERTGIVSRISTRREFSRLTLFFHAGRVRNIISVCIFLNRTLTVN